MNELAPIEIDPKDFFHHHFTLPALPEVVSKIQELIQSDTAGMGKVAELVSGEPALVAQVLKVVNSAYYGLPREVTEVKMAVAFLGLNEIYRMVLSLSVVNTLAIDQKEELNRFWFHSFYTALCTKYLARKFEPRLSTEELWSAAILHDIGKLIYLKFFPDHYKAIMRFCEKEGCLFSESEKHFSLPLSAYFGSLLCDHWRLPNHIKIACESHNLMDLPGIDAKSLSESFRLMICVGNLLAVLSAEELSEATKREIAASTKIALAYTDPEFLTMMGDIYDLRSEVERFMGQVR